MRRRIFVMICLTILLILSCTYYFKSNNQEFKKIPEPVKSQSIIEHRMINKKELTITYYEGNMIDEVVKYGNKITKIIKVENIKNKEPVAFSIKFREASISDDKVTYAISYSNNNEIYEKLKIEKNALTEDQTLYFNLGVEPNSALFFKVELLANNTEAESTIKGMVTIETNLTDRELFMEDFKTIKEEVNKKIYSVNGIETKGYYTLNITSIPMEGLNSSYRGYILLDARDYALIKQIYNIYNDKVMLLNYSIDDELKGGLIKPLDQEIISTLSEESICTSNTNKECLKFGTLKKSNKRTTKYFTDMTNDILKLAKEKINSMDLKQEAYVYDLNDIVNKYQNNRGYIVVDNTNKQKIIYIYITDDFYSVIGYNYTKYGEIKERSGTLRMYVELTYNMAAETKEKACSFVGLTKCQ